MLDKKVRELINIQINKEFYSAYLYLDFSNYFNDLGLDGFAHWYDIQAQEERDHAMLMRQYLHNNGERVTFTAIDQPEKSYSSVLDVLKAGLSHEMYVTSLINTIYAAADEVHDYRTMQCFDWFVKEQGEEEKNADDQINKFQLYGSDPKGLYALTRNFWLAFTQPRLSYCN